MLPNLTEIGCDNGLSPVRRLTIIWTNAFLLSIETLGTYCSEKWKQNTIIFTEENDCRNAVCELETYSSQP